MIVFLQFLGFPLEVVGIFVDMLDGELGYLSEFGVLAVFAKKRICHGNGDEIKRPEVSEEVAKMKAGRKKFGLVKSLGEGIVDGEWRGRIIAIEI